MNRATQSASTAVLLFARAANKEARARHWFTDSLLKKKVATALLRNARKTLRESGLWFVDTSVKGYQQVGDSFGERLVNELKLLKNSGFTNIVVVGSDVPDVTIENLHSTARSLEVVHLCAAPSADGGATILGVNVQEVDLEWLQNLPWTTPALYEALCLQSQQILTTTLDEIDTQEDIFRWFANRANNFANTLKQLYYCTRSRICECDQRSLFAVVLDVNVFQRGPPARLRLAA